MRIVLHCFLVQGIVMGGSSNMYNSTSPSNLSIDGDLLFSLSDGDLWRTGELDIAIEGQCS